MFLLRKFVLGRAIFFIKDFTNDDDALHIVDGFARGGNGRLDLRGRSASAVLAGRGGGRGSESTNHTAERLEEKELQCRNV